MIKQKNKKEILWFNKMNREEYQYYKHKLPREFYILENRSFSYEESIFLLIKKGLFNRTKIIGYAIIYDSSGLDEKDKKSIALINRIDSRIMLEQEWVVISDFMILRFQRRRGIGREFFRRIENDYYSNRDFILIADGDGKFFWRRLGFKYIDKLSKTMGKKFYITEQESVTNL